MCHWNEMYRETCLPDHTNSQTIGQEAFVDKMG